MKNLYSALIILLLASCAHSAGGQSEVYGEIKGGVETSNTRIGK